MNQTLFLFYFVFCTRDAKGQHYYSCIEKVPRSSSQFEISFYWLEKVIAQTRHGIADCVTGSRFQNGDQRSPLWFSEGWADQFGVPEDRIWSENGSKGRQDHWAILLCMEAKEEKAQRGHSRKPLSLIASGLKGKLAASEDTGIHSTFASRGLMTMDKA